MTTADQDFVKIADAVGEAIKDGEPVKACAIALLLIAAELNNIGERLATMNEQNRGVGVFRDCLLAALKKKES